MSEKLAKSEPQVKTKAPTAPRAETGAGQPAKSNENRSGHDFIQTVNDFGHYEPESTAEEFRQQKATEVEKQMKDALAAKEKTVQQYLENHTPKDKPFPTL